MALSTALATGIEAGRQVTAKSQENAGGSDEWNRSKGMKVGIEAGRQVAAELQENVDGSDERKRSKI